MATRRRFIIEHPTRGVLKELESTESGNQFGRFTVEGSRTSGLMFTTIGFAMEARAKIRPQRLQDGCQIRQEPTDAELRGPYVGDAWKVVA
jgi:hypothetical protein